ncbi:hypothetical protein [Nitrospirillum sp. BR 11163]|uniref:hypothetical protein n=1 Tax=Nitrospirillum sp. BR 11163 TaxID=3104323 RepID=UPI002AFF5A65|nr:hypothetical protein [Nitrospirillum sp. BR 11163]MEA1671921.1 hypothetical protein [Nitrospirillum sp. BR 11163]
MLPHKFKVGQNALMRPAVAENRAASTTVSVTRLLPVEGGEPLYRIRLDLSGQERVVRESQLGTAGTVGVPERPPTAMTAIPGSKEARSKAGRKKS